MSLNCLSFVMTNTCNASCGMCCFSCSPQKKEILDKEIVKDYIRQAADMGTVKQIAFTGGEAIIYYDTLRECMEYAKSFGMTSTLVSNGFWGKNFDDGFDKIKDLKEAGLKHISFSVDKFHQEYVPIPSVRNAITIARQLGVLSAITLMDLKDGESVYSSIEEFRDLLYGCNLIVYPCFPAGEAKKLIPEEQFICECDSLFARCPFENTITVLFDGTMMMCCSQFSKDIDMVKVGKFGDTSLKEAVNNLNNNDFIYVLLNNGFSWYVKLAKSFGKKIKDKYCVSCHLCYELFTDRDFVEKCKPFVEKEAQRLRVMRFMSI